MIAAEAWWTQASWQMPAYVMRPYHKISGTVQLLLPMSPVQGCCRALMECLAANMPPARAEHEGFVLLYTEPLPIDPR